MSRATRNNIKRRMGVLFIERKYRTRYEVDEEGAEVIVKVPYDERKILTAPVIQSALGAQFQITGLDNPLESSELALMLRAGALAAHRWAVSGRGKYPPWGPIRLLRVDAGASVHGAVLQGFWRSRRYCTDQ